MYGYASNAEDTKNIDQEQPIKDLYNNWKKYLGEMDFSEEFLYQRILYLNPQSIEKFESFEKVKLSNNIIIYHDIWLRRYLKGELLEKLLKLPPSKYYLRKEKYDASLLFYQTKLDSSQIMILENYSVLLLTFKPDDFDIEKGIKKEYLENFFNQWINIDSNVIPDLLKDPVYYHGMIFANNQKRTNIQLLKGWQDDIICFMTEKGVSLLLFKAAKGRALFGIPTQPDWLDMNKGLYKVE